MGFQKGNRYPLGLVVLALLAAGVGWGQNKRHNSTIQVDGYVQSPEFRYELPGSAPSGACSPNGATQVYGGALYVCNTTWGEVTGGSGVTLTPTIVNRTSGTVLTIPSLSWRYPGGALCSVSNVTITEADAVTGTLRLYAYKDCEIKAGVSGTLSPTLAATSGTITSVGAISAYPADALELATWTTTTGVWGASPDVNESVLMRGPVSFEDGNTTTWSHSGTTATVEVNTDVVATKPAIQAGGVLLCTGSASATAQTCSMTPTLTAYTSGMVIRWKSGAANSSGAITLNVDGLGAKSIKKADGSTDPGTSEIGSGEYRDLTYDGTVFRLPAGTASSSSGYDPLDSTVTYYVEEFLANNGSDFGQLKWTGANTAGSGSSAAQASEAGHDGLMRMTTGATSGNGFQTSLIRSSTYPFISPISKATVAQWVFRVNSTTAVTPAVGWNFSGGGKIDAYAYDDGSGLKWWVRKCTTCASGNGVSTGVAVTTGWVFLTITGDGAGAFTATINGGSPVTITGTNPPDQATTPYFLVTTNESVAKTMDVDRWAAKITIGQRY